MVFYQKNANLNSYLHGVLQNLFASQFLYAQPNAILRLKKLYASIQTKKNKKIHYFYLWLLTGQRPYAAGFKFSWKNTSQNTLAPAKMKRQRVEVEVRKKYFSRFLHQVLWQIIALQTNSEKKVWAYKQLNAQLKMFSVPLTQRTLSLQAVNSFFPNIPLTLQFRFSYTTAFEKLFFLRSLKLLSKEARVKALDIFE